MKGGMKVKVQCGLCDSEIGVVDDQTWQVGGQCSLVCHKCVEEDEISIITAKEGKMMWTVPFSRYPKRDWVTVREAAESIGVPKETLWTWIKRGKLLKYQKRGFIQNTGSTTLIHEHVLDEIKEKKS